jgi:CheY-like chemotaxis protein
MMQAPLKHGDVPASEPKQPPLVMVVDDDAETREICDALLSRAGYTCALASSGEEAVSLLEQATPALIVLDLNMPGMDGWSVAALVRKHERTARIPILVLTGLTQNVENAARRAGATAFCMKPIDSKRFVKEVKRLCPV